MNHENTNYKSIGGWGVDIDPDNNPVYPIKHYTGADYERLNWQRPPLQPQTVEILKSVEHKRMPAVFGTPLPPSGLSGRLRKFAFKYDESEYGHWLNLLLADRINMIEGIADDIWQLRFPNIFAERGMKADWKYNRKELVAKVAALAAITAVIFIYRSKRKSQQV